MCHALLEMAILLFITDFYYYQDNVEESIATRNKCELLVCLNFWGLFNID